MSMRLKLFLLLVILVITMLLGVFAILVFTGTFTAGINESASFIKNELGHISKDISDTYGVMSAETVYFSKNVSSGIEKYLKERDLAVTDLQIHPEILESVISNEFDKSMFALLKTKSSGVFIILDATINRKISGSENSKAGIYIKNMEPNIVNSTSPNILILRGHPNIARKNSLNLHSDWRMEFAIKNAPYFSLPMEASSIRPTLSASYYWTDKIILPGTSEEIMICSAPLIDSGGNVFGVCGFDISQLLFKMTFAPDGSRYKRIFCTLSPVADNKIETSKSMLSGSYSSISSSLKNRDLYISEGKKSLYTYRDSEGNIFTGYHQYIGIYPENSSFYENKWAVALMVPAEDIKSAAAKFNLQLLTLSIVFMIVGIILSLVLSMYYIRPITKSFELIKSNNPLNNARTQITEIDELIEYMCTKEEKAGMEKEQDSNSEILETFLENIKSLSPAERSVFNLYAEQYTAKEIADKLYLSINTIKTHTKKIYMKMNVSSKEELLLYIEMLKEAGKEIK